MGVAVPRAPAAAVFAAAAAATASSSAPNAASRRWMPATTAGSAKPKNGRPPSGASTTSIGSGSICEPGRMVASPSSRVHPARAPSLAG